ncbi:MarR family winged helix-turn-helix transcriptional regulator [Streptomyces sp. CNZ748]|uniref:MarR family winged helix-turn-helix transcriptional regulator n=1 Tax=Streptomyces sp. CNZ748 TaxID=2885160 RepID=UPI000465D970|nr:MarR family winged helix-turn-helix transcriptional regulator [Streptomyces sp. CNZ748]
MRQRSEQQNVHQSAILLDHLARRMRVRSEAALAPFRLRVRHLIALTLLRERGDSPQQQLAVALERDGTNVVGLLNELEAEKLVERIRSPQDRRRHVVRLTAAGVRRLSEAEAVLVDVEREVFAALDADQRESLYHLLRQAMAGQEVPGMGD